MNEITHLVRCMVIGDIGGSTDFHVGDEAMLEANITLLRNHFPDIHVVIMSRDPEFSSARLNCTALLTPNMTANSVLSDSVLSTLKTCDALIISGGGNLCSIWPHLFWLRVRLIEAAHHLNIPIAVIGQTLGPYFNEEEKVELGKVLGMAKLVGVRELPSVDVALQLGIAPSRLLYQVDDALYLNTTPLPTAKRWRWLEQKKWLGLTLDRSFSMIESHVFLRHLAQALEKLLAETECEFIAFLPHEGALGTIDSGDSQAGMILMNYMKNRQDIKFIEVLSPNELHYVTGRAQMVLSSRYHALVFACANNVPAIGIYRCPYTQIKLQGALHHVEMSEHAISFQSLEQKGFSNILIKMWEQRQRLQEHMLMFQPLLNEKYKEKANRLLDVLIQD